MKITVEFNNLQEMDTFCNSIAIGPGAFKKELTKTIQESPATPVQPVMLPQMMPQFQQPPVQQMPVQSTAPQQVSTQTQIPTTAVAQEYTLDQLSVAAAGLVNKGMQPQLLNILHGFGCQALTELQKDMYPAFVQAIRQEGAVI